METTNFLFSSVRRWCKKFKSGVDSVEDASHARRPKTATSQKIVEKVTNLVATDARFTSRHIANCVGISAVAAHKILRRDLKMRRIIPHLVTTEQIHARVKIAKQLLKQFPKYNNRSFYEPKRKIQNKIWATKGGKRPCIAKRTMNIKTVMYVIFFTNQGPAIQIAVPKGKSVNARFYKGQCPSSGGPIALVLIFLKIRSNFLTLPCSISAADRKLDTEWLRDGSFHTWSFL